LASADGNTPRAQAAAAAGGAVPTRGSINRQYGQSISDVEGFTTALARILQQGPQPGAGYQQALGQQQGITTAAQNQLAGLGSPFAAGSAAAVGGLGGSALSSLVARGAAAASYGARMPGVAAARGQFGVQSLEQARQNALQTRGEDYRNAYTDALQQARSNAFSQRMALSQLGLSRQQLQVTKNQDNANRAEQTREFNATNALRWASLGAGTGGVGSKRTLASSLGLSQNELDSHIGAAVKLLQGESPGTKTLAVYGPPDSTGRRFIVGYKTVPVQGSGSQGAIQAGVSFPKAVQALVGQGVREPVAFAAASRIYRSAKSSNVFAWETFVHWMADNGSKQYQRVWAKWNQSSNQPVSFHGQPH
jgi:hypothetical protein